uniref:Uncharacterized protein n=1 Tax=Anguilla anguilla TaxID=7936 RepID=A0A0E9XRX2_ANGAN
MMSNGTTHGDVQSRAKSGSNQKAGKTCPELFK